MVTHVARLSLQRERSRADRHRLADIQLKKLSLLGEMTSSITHELSNPLAAIVTSAQTMLAFGPRDLDRDSGGELSRSQVGFQEDLELILSQARRAGEIISGLLAFARKDHAEPQPVSMMEIIRQVSALARHHLRLHDVVLDTASVRGHDSSSWVEGNPNQLQQLLLNLIINAQQAISTHQTGGTVWITSEHAFDGMLEVAIEDDGPGVPPEMHSMIFEAFYTTKPASQGTGLGLSISAEIARSHGATIRVEDRPGGGARFVISFPTLPDHRPETQRIVSPDVVPIAAERDRAPCQRVLLVDDEPVILHSVGRFLSASGYDVETSASGHEAIAALRSGTYDAVVSDLRMPELSGEEFFATVKVEFPAMASRIVFTSGDMMRETSREFVRESGCPYLQKPYEIADLVTILRKLSRSTDENHDP